MRRLFLSRPRQIKNCGISARSIDLEQQRGNNILYDYDVINRIVNGVASKISYELRSMMAEARSLHDTVPQPQTVSLTPTVKKPTIRTDIDIIIDTPDDTHGLKTNLEHGTNQEKDIDDIGASVDKLSKQS
jgi:hypothetical protein